MSLNKRFYKNFIIRKSETLSIWISFVHLYKCFTSPEREQKSLMIIKSEHPVLAINIYELQY